MTQQQKKEITSILTLLARRATIVAQANFCVHFFLSRFFGHLRAKIDDVYATNQGHSPLLFTNILVSFFTIILLKSLHPPSQVIAENFSSAATSLVFVLTPQQAG